MGLSIPAPGRQPLAPLLSILVAMLTMAAVLTTAAPPPAGAMEPTNRGATPEIKSRLLPVALDSSVGRRGTRTFDVDLAPLREGFDRGLVADVEVYVVTRQGGQTTLRLDGNSGSSTFFRGKSADLGTQDEPCGFADPGPIRGATGFDDQAAGTITDLDGPNDQTVRPLAPFTFLQGDTIDQTWTVTVSNGAVTPLFIDCLYLHVTAFAPPPATQAYRVDTTDDLGVDLRDGVQTLRDAVFLANLDPNPRSVQLSPGPTVELDCGRGSLIVDPASHVTIDGDGASLRMSCQTVPVIINEGTAPGTRLVLNDLWLIGGTKSIVNHGRLFLNTVSLHGSFVGLENHGTALAENLAVVALQGSLGAVYQVDGDLTLLRTRITGNKMSFAPLNVRGGRVSFAEGQINANTGGVSGGVLVGEGAVVNLYGVVITSSFTMDGVNHRAGAIASDGEVNLRETSVFLTQSPALEGGGFTIDGSLIAQTENGPNCRNVEHSSPARYSAADDATCGLTDPSNVVAADLGLERRPFSWAPTPGAESPLIDAGRTTCVLSKDMFGTARPLGHACDIGALEGG